jgi:hypothetical protein
MKLFFIVAFFIAVGISSNAQNAVTTNKSLQELLSYYYELKNALTKDDAKGAAVSAAQFLNTAKSLDIKTLNALEQKTFTSVKDKLIYNADHISEVNELDHQRGHFEKLSDAMIQLAESVQLSQQPVYVDYCPMKKTYWLSSEKTIQNPYYGKQMINCGNETKILAPGKEHSMQAPVRPDGGNDKMDMAAAPLERAGGQVNNIKDTTPKEHEMSNMNNMHHNMPMNDSGATDMKSMNMSMPMGNMSHSFSLNLPMSRNGSGTGWLPDASSMHGHMYHSKNWMYMLHYNLLIRYNNQDLSDKGIRGDEMIDAPNWLMFMGQRQVGEKGLFRFGTMFSLDALVTGQKGYPLLFQSGESAHGEPLIDRQHPHDLFSELSVAYSYALSKKADVFAYVGYPGEPALGPVAFMHRPSAMYDPDAPISHHWIDATHITFGVATLGFRLGQVKVEASSFTGREPGENRYDLDKPKFDSWSGRLSFNPSKNWALQVSHAYIQSPEA